MTTEITTIDPNNYAAMAKAMGIANEGRGKGKSSSLARLRINHSPVMGTAEVNGKSVNVEVIQGGTYKLEVPDGPTYYASSVKVRPYVQRYMYKRFVMGGANSSNRYIKTIMHDDLNVDLKDNDGGFNCGKPAGYIQDFKALPEKTQDLIKQIKRVRVVLGTVEMTNPVNEKGESIELDATPFIWEIDNRDAFKIVGDVFVKLAKMSRLPVMHNFVANTEERKMPNGNSFFIPIVSLNIHDVINVTPDDNNMFTDFLAWVDNYNSYISNAWAENANAKLEDGDAEVLDDLVDIEVDEEAVA
jgi:hypothetical protein|tara:strand:+ start:842 stop:1744 length:903 start_codon:yes stop_codon:yes gene_type:complete